MSKGKPEEPEQSKPTIDERIKQLRDVGASNEEIVRVLYEEEYGTQDIMKRGLPLKSLKKGTAGDKRVQDTLMGPSKGPGYLDELKTMFRRGISRSRELTEIFYDMGLGILLGSLSKSGLTMDEYRKIALSGGGGLREALTNAGETAFKALEYFESDLIKKVEQERDDSRAYATVLESRVTKLLESLDPKLRLEKMIQSYLFSGNVDPDTLILLLDKWLKMEVSEVTMEVFSSK